VTLLASAADHRSAVRRAAVAPLLLGAGHAAIDRCLLPACPAAETPPLQRSIAGTDRWTDTTP